MNTLVKKEIRLLLPIWLVAMALAIVSAWHCRPDNPGRFILPLYGMALLAVTSFGREFSFGTFGMLLAQPISRSELWRAKLAVLAGALGLVAAVCLLCGGVKYFSEASVSALAAVPVAAALAVGGGFCFSLLIRQSTPALVFTLLVPTAIVILASFILERFNVASHTVFGILALALTVGAALGIYWSLRIFASIEETSATATTISLFFRRSREGAAAARPTLRRHLPIVALLRKEFGLQSFSLYGMAALFLLHLAVLALRVAFLRSDTVQARDLDVCLTWFGLLWFLPPFLIAATSICEERRLGTLATQRSLPVAPAHQFLLKHLFVLLCGALSALLFYVAESLGCSWGIKHDLVQSLLAYFGPIPHLPWLSPAIIYLPETSAPHLFSPIGCISGLLLLFLAVTNIAFYAATLTASTLEALGLAATLVILTIAGFSLRFVTPFIAFGAEVTTVPLCVYCLQFVLALSLPFLGWHNFQTQQTRLRKISWNLGGLAVTQALAVALTAAIYFRAWEWVLPSAPHGAPRPALLQTPPSFSSTANTYWWSEQERLCSLLFPDGRLWIGRLSSRPESGQFLPGDDWLDVALAVHTIIGLRRDGSLWCSEYSIDPRQISQATVGGAPPIVMQRVGAEAHWKSLLAMGEFAILLRDDGSLWHWGPSDKGGAYVFFNPTSLDSWPGLPRFPLERLETSSKWTEFPNTLRPVVRDTEGYDWLIACKSYFSESGVLKDITLPFLAAYDRSEDWSPSLHAGRLAPPLPSAPYEAKSAFLADGSAEIAVRKDGTLWILRPEEKGTVAPRRHDALEISAETNWRSAIADMWPIALKADHTLWEYRPSNNQDALDGLTTYGGKPRQPIAWRQIDPHTDWVAIYPGRFALAADGSLWQWAIAEEQITDLPGLSAITLIPSRRPKYLGNIFTSPSDRSSSSKSN